MARCGEERRDERGVRDRWLARPRLALRRRQRGGRLVIEGPTGDDGVGRDTSGVRVGR